MAAGTPVNVLSEGKNNATGAGAYSGMSLSAGDCLVMFHAIDTQNLGEDTAYTLDGGVGAPDFIDAQVGLTGSNRFYAGIWLGIPSGGTYVITEPSGAANKSRYMLAYRVTGVDSGMTVTFVLDNTASGGDTGAINVTSAVGDRVMMGIGPANTPIGDQTELNEASLPDTGDEIMAQHADGASTVDIGATSVGGQTFGAIAFNLEATAAGGRAGVIPEGFEQIPSGLIVPNSARSLVITARRELVVPHHLRRAA